MPATSEKQKRFFGAVMGAKKGQQGVSGAAKKAAKDMTTSQIKDFLTSEDNEEGRNPDKVPLWWLQGIFKIKLPIEKQKQRLKKVIEKLKVQSEDGSAKHNTGTIRYHFSLTGDGVDRIIDVFVPERKTWPKRGHLTRQRNKSSKNGGNSFDTSVNEYLQHFLTNNDVDMITEVKQRLDKKCWKGYRKQGTKVKGGVRVNNCVKIKK